MNKIQSHLALFLLSCCFLGCFGHASRMLAVFRLYLFHRVVSNLGWVVRSLACMLLFCAVLCCSLPVGGSANDDIASFYTSLHTCRYYINMQYSHSMYNWSSSCCYSYSYVAPYLHPLPWVKAMGHM